MDVFKSVKIHCIYTQVNHNMFKLQGFRKNIEQWNPKDKGYVREQTKTKK